MNGSGGLDQVGEPEQIVVVPQRGGQARRRVLSILKQSPLESVGLVLAFLVILMTIIGPLLAPYDPYRVDLSQRLLPPSWTHLFGTDGAGRDVLSRVLYGARLTLVSVAIVIAFATVVGVAVGTAAGMAHRRVDELMMRLVDIALSFPPLILALALAAALGGGLKSAVIALAITWWPGYARLVRSVVLQTREQEFVAGARALGVGRGRLTFRHILPNSLDNLYVQTTLDVAAVTVEISALSFIGVGAQIPQPEWGTMIAEAQNYIFSAWWTVFFPGIAIVLTAVAFSLVGDLLRTSLDPSTRLIQFRM